jgi:hypothetical protein
VRSGGAGATTAAVATGDGSSGDRDGGNGRGGGGGGGGEGERTRPEFFTLQARAVLFVWCSVTLLLVVIYAIVLLFL